MSSPQISPAVDQQAISSKPRSEIGLVLGVSVKALAIFALGYFLLLGLDNCFPYLRPGDDLVAGSKHKIARRGNPFNNSNAGLRVMAFGFSKTLAGFIPRRFDLELAIAGFPNVESYNFGLPGDVRFVEDLQAMAAHGTAPDLALLTFPWPAQPDPGPTIFHFIDNDKELMEKAFPFRHLIRNYCIMALEAHSAFIGRKYAESECAFKQVATDRGYYFISRQDHYRNDELPPDLVLPSDTPGVINRRQITLGPVYRNLARALAAHKIECLFIPQYFRIGELAPADPINRVAISLISNERNISIAGPDYLLYPNRYFSDPVHANRAGAAVYTHDVAVLVSNWLKQHPEKVHRQ